MKITVTHHKPVPVAAGAVKLTAVKTPSRLLGAAIQYKERKRWTGFDLTDGEKSDIREAIKDGATPEEAAKAAM